MAIKTARRAIIFVTATAATTLMLAAPAAYAGGNESAQIAADAKKFRAELKEEAAERAARREAPKTGPLTAAAPSCNEQATTQAFLPFGDSADYFLAPGGSFELGAPGWALEDEARIVSARGGKALRMRKGSEVTSAPVCITQAHPTIRFFVSASAPGGRLVVEALYEDLRGQVRELKIALLTGKSAFAPTPIVPVHVDLRAAVAPTGTAAVAFHLSAEGDDATWLIDDLYVDPFKGS